MPKNIKYKNVISNITSLLYLHQGKTNTYMIIFTRDVAINQVLLQNNDKIFDQS